MTGPDNSIEATVLRVLGLQAGLGTAQLLWHVGASMREARPVLDRLLAEGRIVRTVINDNKVGWALAPDTETMDCGRSTTPPPPPCWRPCRPGWC